MSSKKAAQKQKTIFSGLLLTAIAIAFVIVGPQLLQSSQNLVSNASEGRSTVINMPGYRKSATPTPASPSPSIAPPTTTPAPARLLSPSIVRPCPEDINQNRVVDRPDLVILRANFSKQGSEILNRRADINRDDIVNILDFSLLATKFGSTCR